MTKMKILRGVAGCGKSTYAEAQPGNPVIVSRDRIRLGIFASNDQDYYAVPKEVLKSKEDLVTKIHDVAIAEALRAGKDVIVDNTHVHPRYIKPIADIGYKAGAEVELVLIDVPLNVALERNKRRGEMGGRFVPENIVREQYAALQQSKNFVLEMPELPEPYFGTPGKPAAFLFDLDGTTFHMNGKRNPYAHNVDVDDPDETVLDIVMRFQSTGLLAIAMSGREEITRELSLAALEENGVVPHALFMRSDKDMRKDSVVKAELFDKYVRDNYDVQFVLDDRNQVVDMWRSMGIKTLQVDEGNF